MPRVPPILLVTEIFPPRVGGSGVLFANVYARVGGRVVVLTQEHPDHAKGFPTLDLVLRDIAWQRWGLLHPAAMAHHLRIAYEIKSLAPRCGAAVHCGRAIPEGVAALMARRLGGPRYLCWALGEELEYARTSRELTFLIRRVYEGAEGILAISRHTVKMLAELGVRNKVHLIHPGVDADRFHPDVDGSVIRRRFAPEGQVLLLSVGRLQLRKGHDLVIEALASEPDSFGDVRYVIAGDGEERSRLERLVDERDLRGRVAFGGEVADHELPSYFAACDVFVLPTRVTKDAEGFGIVFLEAAAAARPVIGGRNGGVVDAVEDGETGFLVSGTEVEELARVMRRLVDSRELRARLGAAGRRRVLSGFTWQRASDAVAELHRELMGAKTT